MEWLKCGKYSTNLTWYQPKSSEIASAPSSPPPMALPAGLLYSSSMAHMHQPGTAPSAPPAFYLDHAGVPRGYTYGAAPNATPYGGAPCGQVYYTGGVPHGASSTLPASAPSRDPAALAQYFTNMTQQPSPSAWAMDSGATAHLSKDAGILSTLSSHPMYSHVTVGDGSSVPVSSAGHASLPSLFFLIVPSIFVMS